MAIVETAGVMFLSRLSLPHFLRFHSKIAALSVASLITLLPVPSRCFCSDTALSGQRVEYSEIPLLESDLPKDPVVLFRKWLNEAIETKVFEPNAMNLATCVENQISSRMVLLKDVDDKGFCFFTNYSGRKSHDITINPNVSLCFYWGPNHRQVRIEGVAEKMTDIESDSYWVVRPRGSQLGAWASNQSEEVQSREALDKQYNDIENRFSKDSVVPRPIFWGGWRVVPKRIEFWKGRRGRLHDRIVYSLQPSGEWNIVRLQP